MGGKQVGGGSSRTVLRGSGGLSNVTGALRMGKAFRPVPEDTGRSGGGGCSLGVWPGRGSFLWPREISGEGSVVSHQEPTSLAAAQGSVQHRGQPREPLSFKSLPVCAQGPSLLLQWRHSTPGQGGNC